MIVFHHHCHAITRLLLNCKAPYVFLIELNIEIEINKNRIKTIKKIKEHKHEEKHSYRFTTVVCGREKDGTGTADPW